MNRNVTVTFEDKESLTIQEIESNLHAVYGKNAKISITPVSTSPTSHIQFGISELITEEQALIFFDQPEQYELKLKVLRRGIVKKLLYILNDVIMDNEENFSD